jgi:ribosome-binding protein aMBF1 (putative translation factor)
MLRDGIRIRAVDVAIPTAIVAADDPSVAIEMKQAVAMLQERGGLSQLDLAMRADMLRDHIRTIEAARRPSIPEPRTIEDALQVKTIT